jgi:hypothetical protein
MFWRPEMTFVKNFYFSIDKSPNKPALSRLHLTVFANKNTEEGKNSLTARWRERVVALADVSGSTFSRSLAWPFCFFLSFSLSCLFSCFHFVLRSERQPSREVVYWVFSLHRGLRYGINFSYIKKRCSIILSFNGCFMKVFFAGYRFCLW